MSNAWRFENWIAASWDKLSPGRHILLGIEQWTFRKQSDFQEVAIAEVPAYGRGLFLDSVVEFVAHDEFVYHEALALPPLLFHPSPRRVLIQGGGDGLALREILRDPRVEEVVLVELDPVVVESCKEHLAHLHRDSFDDARATILIQDVLLFLETTSQTFDVVLVDLIDGYDQASVDLYRKVLPLTQRVLARGAVVSAFGDLARSLFSILPVYRALKERFRYLEMHRAAIESFSGAYGFLLASDAVDFRAQPKAVTEERAGRLRGTPRSLVPEHFPSCFALPPYLQDELTREHPPPPSRPDMDWLTRDGS